jgi:hypothetical protein
MQAYNIGYLCGVYYTLKNYKSIPTISLYLKCLKQLLTNSMMITGHLNFKAALCIEGAQDGLKDVVTYLKLVNG